MHHISQEAVETDLNSERLLSGMMACHQRARYDEHEEHRSSRNKVQKFGQIRNAEIPIY